jgi:hypothetical protein
MNYRIGNIIFIRQIYFVLTYVNITNELTNRTKNAGSNRESKYEEIIFIDRVNNKCKAET